MKTMTLAVAALLALGGHALAGEDESAVTIDLSGAQKGVNAYYLKCEHGGRSLSTCGVPSVWENTNGVRGLQTSVSMVGTPADEGLLS